MAARKNPWGIEDLDPNGGIKIPVGNSEKSMPSKEKVWLNFFKSTDIDGECWFCGRFLDFDNMHRGHKIARSKKGSNLLKNLVPLCGYCNSHMQDKPALELLRKENPDRERILRKKGWLIR